MALKGIKGFTFGADPEVFIVNGKGEPVSAAHLLPGSKEEPHREGHVFIHPDGMAAEFGFDPVNTFASFNNSIDEALALIRKFLPDDHSISIVPSVRFSPEEFDRAPDSAKELGCNPDFDAWSGEMNMPPQALDDPYLRTAAGHLHIGVPGAPYEIDDWYMEVCREFVRQLDWFIGAWSCRIDTDATRRKLYGKAGAFRPKPYGVEYRVPSNFWLLNANRREQIWNRMQHAISGMKHKNFPVIASEYNSRLVEQINATKIDKDFEGAFHNPLVELGYL